MAKIEQIPYLNLKIEDQGNGGNRPKSNQVFCRWGSSILPDMKEIEKVVQKLSRKQKTAAFGGGVCDSGSVRTGTKT